MKAKDDSLSLRKKKKERLKITNLNDFKLALKKEEYDVVGFDEEELKKKIVEVFETNHNVVERLHSSIKDGKTTYKANDIKGFIDYIEKIILFENEHNKLGEKINKIKNLYIDRVEFERVPSYQENVDHILKAIDEIKGKISGIINEEEKRRLEELEKEIDKDYLYAKDIELLKKMIINKESSMEEKYNSESQIKSLFIEIPKEINDKYIPVELGSVEYYQHLSSNIPRIQRLRRNIESYIKIHDEEQGIFRINQSNALQDSINIALATYDNKEFKAISGSNELEGYCKAPTVGEGVFISSKVNKLGKLGIGYNRINDSEKKILEKIHRGIEVSELRDDGHLILYSKWEPCPSCYFIIYQFCERYPNITVEVKYEKSYGEK